MIGRSRPCESPVPPAISEIMFSMRTKDRSNAGQSSRSSPRRSFSDGPAASRPHARSHRAAFQLWRPWSPPVTSTGTDVTRNRWSHSLRQLRSTHAHSSGPTMARSGSNTRALRQSMTTMRVPPKSRTKLNRYPPLTDAVRSARIAHARNVASGFASLSNGTSMFSSRMTAGERLPRCW